MRAFAAWGAGMRARHTEVDPKFVEKDERITTQAPEATCVDAQGQANKRCGEGEVCAHDHGGTCVSLPKAGEACVDQFVCGDGLYCVNAVCIVQRPNGDPCAKDLECLGGRCSAGTCADLPAFCDPFASPP